MQPYIFGAVVSLRVLLVCLNIRLISGEVRLGPKKKKKKISHALL